jgi:hypothetical protein
MTYIYWLIDKYMRCRAVLVYIRQLIDEYKWDLEVGVSLFSVRLAPVLILTPAATAALLVPRRRRSALSPPSYATVGEFFFSI